jgi:hypothetical protein
MVLPLHLDPHVPGSTAARRAALAEAAAEPLLFLSGLDLGMVADYTALVTCERTTATAGGQRTHCTAVRHIQRWPLKTSYTQLDSGTVQLFAQPPLAGSTLAIDATGVGRPVVQDLFKRTAIQAKLRSIVITGGTRSGAAGDGFHVAKVDLIGALLAVVGTRRFAIVPSLPLAEILGKELSTFKRKMHLDSGSESFEAWRESDHDDLVLAAALAVWTGERGMQRANVFV